MNERHITYFDTSAYNWLLGMSANVDEIKEQISDAGLRPFLSPANVFEFSGTTSELQRERLVFLAQRICEPSMLLEIEAIIANFIGERHKALGEFVATDIAANSVLQPVWSEVQSDHRRTFSVDREHLRQFRMLSEVMKVYHSAFIRDPTFSGLVSAVSSFPIGGHSTEDICSSLRHLGDALRADSHPPHPDERSIPLNAAILNLIFIVVASGLSPYNQRIEKMWSSAGLENLSDRLDYCTEHLNFLTQEGPLVGMGAILAGQTLRKYNRGNYLDCFHAAYSPHVDEVLTADVGLLECVALWDAVPHFAKVRHISERVPGFSDRSAGPPT